MKLFQSMFHFQPFPFTLQTGRYDCGGNVFKAATDHAARLKKQDERGFTMLCCRHGYVLRAVNMLKGEIYRHIHYLHKHAFEKKMQVSLLRRGVSILAMGRKSWKRSSRKTQK